MAKQIINVGTGPNTGTADSIRVAFEKVNANFTELYTATDLSAVAQHILPATTETYDLGSDAKRWRSLYVSENTIYFGNKSLSINQAGGVEVDGVVIATPDGVQANADWNATSGVAAILNKPTLFSGSYDDLTNKPTIPSIAGLATEDYVDNAVGAIVVPDVSNFITADDIPAIPADISDLTDNTNLLGGGAANTGDITFDATTISAPNEDEIVIQSKDINGFGTARVTLNSEYGGNARLRAFSNESVDTFTLANGDFATGVWQDNGFGNGVVEFTGAGGIGDFFQNTLFNLTPDNVSITINSEPSFVWNGGANGSGTDTPGFGTNPIVPATPIAITSIEFRYRSESFISVNYDNQEIRLNVQNGGITFDANNTIQMFGDSNIELQSGSDFSISSGQNISIGTSSSDSISLSTGDLNFTAFDDVNFRGSDSFRLRNTSATAPIRIITDDNNTSKTWAFNPDGNLTLPGNLQSEGDISIDINLSDSTLRRWTFTEGGDLTFPDGTTQTTAFTGSVATGDITFDGVKIQGAGTASGDGNGYSTIELVPDTDLYANDQYLVIDPTQPNHIHIRAGGTQDASNAELYLGGEKNNVRIIDSVGVRLYNEVRDDTFSSFSDPADFNTATWYGTPGNYFVQFTEVTAGMGNLAFAFGNDAENRVTVSYGAGESSVLTYGGSTSNLGGGVYRFAVVEAPPASPTALTAIEFQIWTTNDNRVELQYNDFTVAVNDDVRITGNDLVSLRNTSSTEPVTIHTDYDGVDRVWEFAANGTLTTPGDIVVAGDVTGTSGASTLVLRAQPGSNTVLQLNDIVDSEIRTAANLVIRTDISNTPNVWTFGTDGGLTFPDATVQTTAYPGPITFLNGDVKGSVFADDSTLLVDAVNGTIPYGVLSGAPSLGNFTFNSNTLSTTTGSLDIAVGNKTYSLVNNTEFGINYLEIPGYIQGGLQTNFLSSNGLGISIDGANSPNTVDIGNISSSTVLRLKDGVGVGNIVIQSLGTSLKLQTNNNSTWEFNDNIGLIFPDATAQTTAFTGTANNIASEDAVEIRINLTDSTTHTWRFGEDGHLNLPSGGGNIQSDGTIQLITGSSTFTVTDDVFGFLNNKNGTIAVSLVGGGVSIAGSGNFAFSGNAFGATTTNDINLTSGSGITLNSPVTEVRGNNLILVGDDVDIQSEGGVNIDVNLSDSTLRRWHFGEDGILNLPEGGDIVDSTGTSVLGGGGSGSVLEEPFESKSSATGVIEHDATTNRLFRHTSISANFTANFTNLGLTAGKATSISLVLVQGATARMCTAVQIGGAAQTITWQGSASAPLGNANRTDVVTFSILCTATDTYTVLGMLTSFGG